MCGARHRLKVTRRETCSLCHLRARALVWDLFSHPCLARRGVRAYVRTLGGFSALVGPSGGRARCGTPGFCPSSRITNPFPVQRGHVVHRTGNLVAPELMGQVAIPYKWREFMFHRGCSFSVTSIFTSGLIAGGRAGKEGKQTIFFTPPNPFGYNPDEKEPIKTKKRTLSQLLEEYSGRRLLGQFSPSTGQRTTILADKVQCCYCIQFCVGRLHVPSDCSKKNEFYSRDSRRLDPPKCCTQKFLAKAAAAYSNSSKTLLGVQQLAARNSLRKFW